MNQQHIEETNERAMVIIFGVAGTMISLLGYGFGIFADHLYFLAVPLGLIVIGISEILEKLNSGFLRSSKGEPK